MANCPVQTNKLIGRNAVIRIAPGCPDRVPAQSAFKRIGAITTKSFDLSPNSITSEADDTKGLIENIVTNMDLSISFDGEYRKRDKDTDFGPLKLLQEIPKEVQMGRQPAYWVQMDFTGEDAVVLQGYFVFTSWSSEFPASEIATYSGELKVSDADSIEWLVEEVAVTGVSVTPATLSVKAGETGTFTVNFTPTDATNKNYTVVSDKANFATVSKLVNVVTVTGVAAGTANVTVTSEDGAKTAKCVVAVTAA
ncbi:Ig-like domain-containing protein [Providencia stuartii]|uniref:Ig-like domain-containing protein n=1 Tax=Providencia stuartii TaxID=588 RepID=UPI0023ECC22D|nr:MULTISPECIES: Ig-like domain-containing protein [Providencia]MDF4176309.1 Ig-like domain-containing protein [Providencia thailandensis]CAK6614987.1 Bacterial group 2 Ig-like protein [Providencia stuartii]CAK6616118.1 Bacterial group 2 Ig-like protein [Providencia stuartii]CAK6616171.1 Bacterial group 2 Ig-like protein [Providencia stuartii]CAK6617308.1 Bacterial group 2 Ig-like protein [Providencia stuartii]